MRTWIAEGRVNRGSLVWREGWPDWKQAGPLFPGLLAGAEMEITGLTKIPQIEGTAQRESAVDLYRRRKSPKTAVTVVVLLVIACLILFATLVYVVNYVN